MSRARAPLFPLLLLAFATGACGPLATPWGGRWSDDWRAEADPSRQSRKGDTWVLLTREPAPDAVRESRERWTTVGVQDGNGEFLVERESGAPRTAWEPLHPRVPTMRRTRGGRPAEGVRLEAVQVPAGRYLCARTSRTTTEHEGRVMRVDEWWAPNVPVPVQRWSRWQAHASGVLRNPPRRPADQPLGTTWSVLERRPAR